MPDLFNYSYKPRASNIVDENGTPDQNEFLNVRKCNYSMGILAYKTLDFQTGGFNK